MTLHGQARASTTDQDLAPQEASPGAAGGPAIRSETRTGTSREGRALLDVPLQVHRAPDALLVTRIDRPARSLGDLLHERTGRGVALQAPEPPVDASTAAGKAVLDVRGVVAEFDADPRRERRRDGTAAARARGPRKGRKPRIDPGEVRRPRAVARLSPTAIAKWLGIARSGVYRVLPNERLPSDPSVDR